MRLEPPVGRVFIRLGDEVRLSPGEKPGGILAVGQGPFGEAEEVEPPCLAVSSQSFGDGLAVELQHPLCGGEVLWLDVVEVGWLVFLQFFLGANTRRRGSGCGGLTGFCSSSKRGNWFYRGVQFRPEFLPEGVQNRHRNGDAGCIEIDP